MTHTCEDDRNSHEREDIHTTHICKVMETHTCKKNKHNSHMFVIKLINAKRDEVGFEPKTFQ